MASKWVRKAIDDVKLRQFKKRLAHDLPQGQWEVNLAKPRKGWEQVAAGVARFLGRDDDGNSVVALERYTCMLMLEMEVAGTRTCGDVVNVTFPFCTPGKVETAKAVVIGPMEFNSKVGFVLELFEEPSWFPQPVVEKDDPATGMLPIDLGIHLLARCSSEDKVIAHLATGKLADIAQCVGSTLDGSWAHGFAIFLVHDAADVKLLGITVAPPGHRETPYKNNIVDFKKWHLCVDHASFRGLTLLKEEADAIRAAGFQRRLKYYVVEGPGIPYYPV